MENENEITEEQPLLLSSVEHLATGKDVDDDAIVQAKRVFTLAVGSKKKK